MNLEGRVLIDITRGEKPSVQVSYSQPGDVTRVLEGKTPAAVLATIPVLFSLCAKAQSHAARLALDAAEGRTRAVRERAILQSLTEMESLRENTLRIALDWPRLLGEPADPSSLKALMRLVPDLGAALQAVEASRHEVGIPLFALNAAFGVISRAEAHLVATIFGEPIVDWKARGDVDAVASWSAARHTVAARLLDRIRTRGQSAAGAITLRPLAPLQAASVRTWLGEASSDMSSGRFPLEDPTPVPETTLLARHWGDPRLGTMPGSRPGPGLWARLTARLIELSQLPQRMRNLLNGYLEPSSGLVLGEGCGMSEIAAARGTLVHAASIENGYITRYRVLSPTRWNFDAGGVAARTVSRIVAEHGAEAGSLSELMVNAVDPCVAYSVRLN
ncbi:MAG TPA: hypothetical protein P5114_09710 [Hyphomicrobiaceae bacterium]|nr:hypothetical protein [Hyphomicrobiaceae bacterium]